jgi:hypothetical protein
MTLRPALMDETRRDEMRRDQTRRAVKDARTCPLMTESIPARLALDVAMV